MGGFRRKRGNEGADQRPRDDEPRRLAFERARKIRRMACAMRASSPLFLIPRPRAVRGDQNHHPSSRTPEHDVDGRRLPP